MFYFSNTEDAEVEDGNGSDNKNPKRPLHRQELDTDDDSQDDEDEDGDDSDPDNLNSDIPRADADKPKSKKDKPKEADSDNDEEEEEEEDEDDQEDEDNDDEDEDESEKETSSINLIANDLVQKGVLKPKEGVEYEDSDVGLAKLVQDTKEAELLEDVPDEYSSILDAIKQGIPVADWVALVAPDEDLKNADLDDEDNQIELVTRLYKKNGFSDSQIGKKISRLKKNDELKDEAEDAQQVLIEDDEKLKAENNRKISEARIESEKKHKEFIDTIKKDADNLEQVQGVYLNKKNRKELADYVTKAVNNKGETQYMIDRNNPEILLQAAFLVKNAKSDIITKVASSKAAKSLKEQLDKKNDKMSSGKGGNSRDKSARNNRQPEGLPWQTSKVLED